jgi:hypothetical protein
LPVAGNSSIDEVRQGYDRGQSVETEFIALDVKHHQARLVVVVGGQQPKSRRAEPYEPLTFGLQSGQAFWTHEPGTDPHVEV